MDLIASLGMSGVPLLAATALGLLMAISPCTLATSVAAVMFIAGGTAGRWRFVLIGGLYTLGRIVTYAGLAFLIVSFGLNTKELAVFFQQYGERLLAPVLIVAGLWLLGLLPRVKGPRILSRVQEPLSGRPARGDGLSAFLLGMLLKILEYRFPPSTVGFLPHLTLRHKSFIISTTSILTFPSEFWTVWAYTPCTSENNTKLLIG